MATAAATPAANIKGIYPDCDDDESDDDASGVAAGATANEATRAADTDGTTLAAPNADRRYVLARSEF